MNKLQVLWAFLVSIVKVLLGWILPSKYKSVEGEICLITGAGNGIGQLMALEFAKRKAKLILWDIDRNGLEESERMIKEVGGTSVFIDVCDLSKKEEVKAAAARAREAVGDVTILVNNAGITYCKDLLDLSDHQIEQTFKVNTLAHFWTLREFLPTMQRNNHGHVVTIASAVGLFPLPGMPDYIASKHAAVGLHQTLYFELQKRKMDGVKTTLVCPHHITTGLFKGLENSRRAPPSLTPERVAKTVLHATLTNQEFLAIPRYVYVAYNIVTWLPMCFQVALCGYLGSNQTVELFVPNREYQKSDL